MLITGVGYRLVTVEKYSCVTLTFVSIVFATTVGLENKAITQQTVSLGFKGLFEC